MQVYCEIGGHAFATNRNIDQDSLSLSGATQNNKAKKLPWNERYLICKKEKQKRLEREKNESKTSIQTCWHCFKKR